MSTEVRQRNKAKKRKEPIADDKPEKDVASKTEYAIAKWMRKNILIKKTKFLSHTVEYFTATKAVDQLLESPWAKKEKEDEPLFTSRESIVKYLDTMLRHKFFHRARKIVVPESELKSSKKKKDKNSAGGDGEKSEKNDKNDEKVDESSVNKDKKKSKKDEKEKELTTGAESSHAETADSKQDKTKKKKNEVDKKKRKIRLDMHLEQRFVDGLDAYVWIYEPTPFYYYFFGALVVIAVIAVCLFPLWPSSVRDGVYYLSLAAAGFLVFILGLAVLRLLIFSLIWCMTFGNHHFWLLPNLTEDVGFFASFWPLYKYEYKGTVDPDDDDEDEEEDENDDEKSTSETKNQSSSNNTKLDDNETAKNENNSETESESSQKSITDKDFEIVSHEEIES